MAEKLADLDKEIEMFEKSRNVDKLDYEYGRLMGKVSETTKYVSDRRLSSDMVNEIIGEVYDKCRKARSRRMVRELGY